MRISSLWRAIGLRIGENSKSLPCPFGVQVRGLQPLGQNRQAIRTGGRSSPAAAPAMAAAGPIASSSGRPTIAPRPRSTVLRVIGRFFRLIAGVLFHSSKALAEGERPQVFEVPPSRPSLPYRGSAPNSIDSTVQNDSTARTGGRPPWNPAGSDPSRPATARWIPSMNASSRRRLPAAASLRARRDRSSGSSMASFSLNGSGLPGPGPSRPIGGVQCPRANSWIIAWVAPA